MNVVVRTSPLISVIVSVYNAERFIGSCIESLMAMDYPNDRVEIIVVDNNSNDRTAELAKHGGARVCFEPINQIARARNAGAAVADGDWFMFVDADSFVTPALLTDIFGVIDSGVAIGCGSTMQMAGVARWARFTLWLWSRVSVLCRWAAGSLMVGCA